MPRRERLVLAANSQRMTDAERHRMRNAIGAIEDDESTPTDDVSGVIVKSFVAWDATTSARLNATTRA